MDENIIKTGKEGVFVIFKGSELISIIRRDEVSRKHLVYNVQEATGQDIVDILSIGASLTSKA